jgi:hypothetical protein
LRRKSPSSRVIWVSRSSVRETGRTLAECPRPASPAQPASSDSSGLLRSSRSRLTVPKWQPGMDQGVLPRVCGRPALGGVRGQHPTHYSGGRAVPCDGLRIRRRSWWAGPVPTDPSSPGHRRGTFLSLAIGGAQSLTGPACFCGHGRTYSPTPRPRVSNSGWSARRSRSVHEQHAMGRPFREGRRQLPHGREGRKAGIGIGSRAPHTISGSSVTFADSAAGRAPSPCRSNTGRSRTARGSCASQRPSP